jgi:diaminohydroxyphosphoribosylaminopyrimidine deaminase/5-amino-6-(5-phosphoribosylamino)uracil reductase
MTVTNTDCQYMRLALREARKGEGRTSPNPAVGAVVVRNGQVVGKGYHHQAGTPHAEVHALRAAGQQAKGATLYVTLEPCNHTGRTPPCSHAVHDAGIQRVVVGMGDPNPHVLGNGASYLIEHGIPVTMGVLESECRQLIRPFLKHSATGLPWVIMKAGSSLDGRIATRTGHSGWITGEQSRRQVHRLRDRVDGILIGVGTALADNPSLTTRLPKGGRDAVRMVLDSHLRLEPTARLLTQSSPAPTWVFCGPHAKPARQRALEAAGAVVQRVGLDNDGRLAMLEVLQLVGAANLNTLLVEGGSGIHGAFLRQRLVDEVMLFVAPLFLGGDGLPLAGPLGVSQVGDGPRLTNVRTRRFGEDMLIRGEVAWVEVV